MTTSNSGCHDRNALSGGQVQFRLGNHEVFLCSGIKSSKSPLWLLFYRWYWSAPISFPLSVFICFSLPLFFLSLSLFVCLSACLFLSSCLKLSFSNSVSFWKIPAVSIFRKVLDSIGLKCLQHFPATPHPTRQTRDQTRRQTYPPATVSRSKSHLPPNKHSPITHYSRYIRISIFSSQASNSCFDWTLSRIDINNRGKPTKLIEVVSPLFWLII